MLLCLFGLMRGHTGGIAQHGKGLVHPSSRTAMFGWIVPDGHPRAIFWVFLGRQADSVAILPHRHLFHRHGDRHDLSVIFSLVTVERCHNNLK
jgi:hypothetical protein